MTRPLRVLHCPTTVGGNPPGLARAERRLGLDSRCVTFRQNYLAYPADEVLVPAWAHGAVAGALGELAALGLLVTACRRYDIVHFNYGSTLLPATDPSRLQSTGLAATAYRGYASAVAGLDCRLLRRCGRGIVATYQGDDARQGDDCRRRYTTSIAHAVGPGYYTEASDRWKRASIRRLDRYAHRLFYLNPDLGWVLPARARFTPYAHIDPRQWRPVATDRGRLLVIHAPTNRDVKGTAHVLAAVERLRAEGLDFDFRLIEGLSHAEARLAYAAADLLVDQLLAGWYGGLAVELMALGKPVVCFLRHEDFGFLPEGMAAGMPLVEANPATLQDVLRRLIVGGRPALVELGARGRRYVERWHDQQRIAADMARHYDAIAHEMEANACAASPA